MLVNCVLVRDCLNQNLKQAFSKISVEKYVHTLTDQCDLIREDVFHVDKYMSVLLATYETYSRARNQLNVFGPLEIRSDWELLLQTLVQDLVDFQLNFFHQTWPSLSEFTVGHNLVSICTAVNLLVVHVCNMIMRLPARVVSIWKLYGMYPSQISQQAAILL